MKRLSITVSGRLASILKNLEVDEYLDEILEDFIDAKFPASRIRQPQQIILIVSDDQYTKLRQIAANNKVDVSTALGYCLALFASANRIADESVWRDKLHKQLGGQIEVKTTSGRIDLLTSKEVIEVKVFDRWKSALGQVLAYHFDFNLAYKPVIALFGRCPEANRNSIVKVCKHYGVEVMFLD